MGLTVAEAFMLVAFVLLMLLVFWDQKRDDEYKDKYKEARELTERLSPEEQAAVADAKEKGELRILLIDLRKKGIDVPKTTKALLSGAVPVQPVQLNQLKNRARLVDETEIRRLAEAAAILPPEHKRTLSNLVSLSEAGELVEKVAALQEVLQKRSVDEITNALDLREHLDPKGKASNEGLKEMIRNLRAQAARVRDRLVKEERAREQLVTDLKTKLGAQIAEVGGRIETTGKIIVPDKVLFTRGEAEIRPQLASFLRDFCPHWLATLRKSETKADIGEIRIEGHSSSEWISADTPQKAWVLNLDLSQRRAQAVLERCLGLVTGSALGDWARKKLTAVGYSSSRPVLADGGEDLRLSRRVVFGAEPSRERLLKEIGGDVKASPAQVPNAARP